MVGTARDLDRHQAVEIGIMCGEHRPHGAGAELALHRETPDAKRSVCSAKEPGADRLTGMAQAEVG
jgi:hypothetical protein